MFGCGCSSSGSARLPRCSPRDRVGFRLTAEFSLRPWPSVLRDVVFLHGPGSGAA